MTRQSLLKLIDNRATQIEEAIKGLRIEQTELETVIKVLKRFGWYEDVKEETRRISADEPYNNDKGIFPP